MHTIFPALSDTITPQFTIKTFLFQELFKQKTPFSLEKTSDCCLFFPTKGSIALSPSPSFSEHFYSLKKEQALLLPAHSGYYLKPELDCAFFYITFSGTLANSLLKKALQQGNYLLGSDYFLIEKDLKQLLCLLTEKNSCQEELEIICFSLLTHLSNHTSTQNLSTYPPLVSVAMRLMEENYTYLYGIEELASQLEVSKNHLIRLFHDCTGISPGQYLTAVKIKNAKLLLNSGESSLELIAISCGFSGADYFRKVFKKETGISPKQYQKQKERTSITSTALPDELYL